MKKSIFSQFKKLNRDELLELVKRIEQINGYILVVQGLETQKAVWLNNKIKEKGLDVNQRYHIDFKTGRLMPIAQPTNNVPPAKPVEVPKE